jgi:hypothetical protein
MPEMIEVFDSGALSAHAYPHLISINKLKFLAAGLFGPGRPCGFDSRTKWTGNSYRYGVYLFEYRDGRLQPVILRCCGSGASGVMFSDHAAETWKALASSLIPEQLWDVCHGIMELSDNMQFYTQARIHHEFAEGRLVKRRRHGNVYIETKAAARRETESNDATDTEGQYMRLS